MSNQLEEYNGAIYSGEPRIIFGPHDSQNMPHDWASRGLTWLYAQRPQVFADMMTIGILGIEKRAGRRS